MNTPSASIVHALPGRLRLKLSGFEQNMDSREGIDLKLSKLDGVDEVTKNSGTGDLILHYDQCQATNPKFFRMVAKTLGVSPKDICIDNFDTAIGEVEHDGRNGNGVEPASNGKPLALPATMPNILASIEVIHSLPGRVRLRVPALQIRAQLAEALPIFLQDQEGIQEVSVNSSCSSVTVTFDSITWNGEKLCHFLRGFRHEEIEAYQPKQVIQEQAEDAVDEESGPELWYSSTGIAIALFVEPLAAIAVPVFLLAAALPMLKRAYHSVAVEGKLNVDVLDASATALMSVQGAFPMATGMVFLINVADYIRDLTVLQSKKAIEEVLAYQKTRAWVIRDGQTIQIPVSEIQRGETVVVYPGERISIDGTVQSGKALVDQATLTGESMPVEKNTGDPVYAATVLREGELYIQAEQIGDETEAARIVRLVEGAPARETKIQNYAVKWANDLVPYSFGLGAVGAVIGGGIPGAAAVLIVDYGTGIRIAAPTTVLCSMTKAIRHGILIKGGRHMENLAEVDAVVFDKTGTLTMGHPDVVDICPLGSFSADEVLSLAAAAENRLTHPVAQAIVRAAQERGLIISERTTSDYTLGLGVESIVDGRIVLVGNHRYMTGQRIPLSKKIKKQISELEDRSVSPLCVAVDGKLAGLLSYTDPIRPEATEVIHALKERGIKEIVMLTGDHEKVAKRVALDLGIDRYIAEVFPGQKADVVKDLQRQGYKVAVVGDGINDSPALAFADVGIAVEGGTQVAQDTAHVTLLHGGLWKIPAAIDISREAISLIHQNWKIISIPNTFALGLACIGILGPIGATLLSNGSAIIATLNGLRPIMGKPAEPPRTMRVLESQVKKSDSWEIETAEERRPVSKEELIELSA
ncbi:MAG: ATPase [Nitrospirales bacterium]|nr:MAG: ATPase [Nitrospirales bacterium]